MTRRSIVEYAEALRPRYEKGTKEQKGRMLDEFTQVSGLHRKAAIRLLLKPARVCRRRGRRREYTDVVEPLRAIWEASDRLCSKLLRPLLPEMIMVSRCHRELDVESTTEHKLCEMSASTIVRLLRPYRSRIARKPLSTTRAGRLLNNLVPVRTFSDWDKSKPTVTRQP